MRINKIYITAILVMAIGLFGCKKDWLDVNEDPETTEEADPELLIYNAQLQYSTNRTTEIGLAGSMWSQLWASGGSAGGVFINAERYNFSNFTTGNTWRSHFPSSLSNLKFAIDIAENGQPQFPYMAAQAKLTRALIIYTTTVLWEDVPYTEALSENIESPRFDRQEEILNGLITEIDNAIAQIENADDQNIAANDFYYGRDGIEKWKNLGRSLKFRILVLMAEKDPSKQTEIIEMLAEGGMIDSETEALFPYYEESGHFNPNWNVLNQFAGGQNLFYFASEVTVETMKRYNDPRLSIYFVPGNDTTEIIGIPSGSTDFSYGENARISFNVVKPDAPERVFTYTEQLLLEAEAEYLYGSTANAQQKLNAAITNSMNRWGVAPDSITVYLAQPSLQLPDRGVDKEAGLQIIGEQTWIAFIDKPIEAWTAWRRMKYPRLSKPVGARADGVVRRLPYPLDELSANQNAPVDPPLEQPMWFETRPVD